LKRERFEKITGSDHFETVWNAILKAHAAGFKPVKLNTVVLSGVNDDELADLARLTFAYPFHVRFIEYMPVGKCSLAPEKPLLAPEILKRLEKLGELVPLERVENAGPARRFKYEGATGEIGLISAMSQHFCETCNRLRLTACGKLRTCLLSDAFDDLKGPLRSGWSDKRIADLILDAVARKPAAHCLTAGGASAVLDQMSTIGG
jgi:cyclic pyranopterin phosphate synthase